MKRILLPLVAAGTLQVWLTLSARAQEVTYSPFGPRGEGGTKNGQTLKIGSGGTVFELDAFVRVNGQDLNGAAAGVAAQLSRDALPAGLSYSFTPRLTADGDLVMTYVFTNGTAGTLTNAQFFFLLDAEIDQETNTFFNEFGVLDGSPGLGASDVLPDRWQIDEPGFAGGQLFANLYAGGLSNSNAIPAGSSNDVALALGFVLGDVPAGNSVGVAVEVSGRGNSLGSLRLVQRDAGGSPTTVTLSGLVATLAGTIFLDTNTNGSPDNGEGLPNVTLRLSDGTNLVAQVATDSSGNYSFNTPPAGTYTLAVDVATLPSGLVNTVDPDGTADNATTTALVPGQLNLKNWGYRTQILKGLVFQDANNNGAPDAGDPRLAGVKLTLQDTNGVAVAEATSDAGGNYNFATPPTGTFALQVDTNTVPAGLLNSSDPDGAPDNRTTVVMAPGGTVIVNWGYRVPVVSGLANVTAQAGLNFQWRLYQPGGWLIGTLTITNLSSGVSFAAPFQLGLPTSTNYWLARPEGTLASGAPYEDLSAAVNAALGARISLAPGQTVTVDGVEMYSRDRSAPPTGLFELWAAQQ